MCPRTKDSLPARLTKCVFPSLFKVQPGRKNGLDSDLPKQRTRPPGGYWRGIRAFARRSAKLSSRGSGRKIPAFRYRDAGKFPFVLKKRVEPGSGDRRRTPTKLSVAGFSKERERIAGGFRSTLSDLPSPRSGLWASLRALRGFLDPAQPGSGSCDIECAPSRFPKEEDEAQLRFTF